MTLLICESILLMRRVKMKTATGTGLLFISSVLRAGKATRSFKKIILVANQHVANGANGTIIRGAILLVIREHERFTIPNSVDVWGDEMHTETLPSSQYPLFDVDA